jgi:hypothetical protein
LERLLADERANVEAFGVLPSASFVETASLFMENGRESLADAEGVRQLVEAIVECRKGKVLAGWVAKKITALCCLNILWGRFVHVGRTDRACEAG